MLNYHVTINGLDVQAHYSDRAVREIFLPFLLTLRVDEEGEYFRAFEE